MRMLSNIFTIAAVQGGAAAAWVWPSVVAVIYVSAISAPVAAELATAAGSFESLLLLMVLMVLAVHIRLVYSLHKCCNSIDSVVLPYCCGPLDYIGWSANTQPIDARIPTFAAGRQ